MEKLKPCPFCGGEAKLHYCMSLENETMAARYEGKMGVHCTVCHIATMPMSEEDAIKAWNRRAERCEDETD